jgi:hypothetical protein
MPVIRIQETAPGPQNIGVLGFIWYCNVISNPNDISILFDTWIEFYVLRGTGPTQTRTLVETRDKGFYDFREPHRDYVALSSAHPIFVNETATTGGAQYMIHMVAEAYASKAVPFTPPLMDERWINVTFTPGSSDTLYREGGECGAFGP